MAEKGKQSERAASQKRTDGGSVFTHIVISVLVLAVLALGLLLFMAKHGLIFSSAPAQPQEAARYTLTCYIPDAAPITVSAEAGTSVSVPEAPQIDGYTFLGWADAGGNVSLPDEIVLNLDVELSARYAIAFRDESGESEHGAYMFLDDGGYFHPSAGMLRGETVEIIYSILDTEAVGSGKFADVQKSDSFYRAAATLKDLGVIGGSRLHPDEPMTYRELFEILACFFPRSGESFSFENIPESDADYPAFCLAVSRGWIEDLSILPDGDIPRGEAAHIFNLLRGRRAPADISTAMVGTILDVSARDRYYADIAEAVIDHGCVSAEGGEKWISSKPLELREEGFFFVDAALHYIDDTGSAYVNESLGGITFGSDGAVTTGVPELDLLVRAKLLELMDFDKMTREQMLRNAYDYVTYHNSYLRANYYETGETGWENDEAYRMLTTGKGNCYCFAAEFAVLAKALGYDAKCYSGTIGVGRQKHGWVEIDFDGVTYVFDPNIEYEEHIYMHRTTCMYRLPPDRVTGWYYAKEAPAET